MPERRQHPAALPAPGLRCVAWKTVRKNTLQGFADMLLPRAGVILLECALHEKPDGTAWVNPPARELRDAEGRRTGWKDSIAFVDRDARRAWSEAALAAVQEWRRTHPEEAGPERQAAGGFEW